MKKRYIPPILCLLVFQLLAQENFPTNDVKDRRANARAFTHVTLHVDARTVLENATLLIRDGKIVAAGQNLAVPADATVYDLSGKHIYPAFIDPYSSYGLPEVKRGGRGSFGGKEQIAPETKGAYGANDAIKAQFRAAEVFQGSAKDAADWRKSGFSAVLSLREDGIARGTAALVSLDERSDSELVLVADAAAAFSLQKGSSNQNFPSSTMGAIALLRQTHYDATWYAAQNPRPYTDQTLDAWLAHAKLPQLFDARNWKDALRAADLGKEIGKSFIVFDHGDAYQRLAQIKAAGLALIVSLDFPKAPEVKDALDNYNISLAEMKHWELAPGNAAAIAAAGIPFALSAHGLDKKDFMRNLRKAIERGLSEEQALAALTESPAKLLGVEERVGSLKAGRLANFLITDGPIFGKESRILENWTRGSRYLIADATATSLAGSYELRIEGREPQALIITGKTGDYSAKFKADKDEKPAGEVSGEKPEAKDPAAGKPEGKDAPKSDKPKLSIDVLGDTLTLLIQGAKPADDLRLSGWRKGQDLAGRVALPDGRELAFAAVRTGDAPKDDKDKGDEDEKKDDKTVGPILYPFVEHGWQTKPTQETVLFKNTTVWTNEQEGILQGADVLVADGKIKAVGKNLSAANARVIDATGKHLTTGIIDEHSHIALDSTNDTATNSGMVRMGDVVDSEDVDIYRNLAGGVVASQLLHGSANPIGGQSALVKLRWGASPKEMLIEGADGFIKFALGENVKRSSNDESIRYPQTRMGVEQVYVDAFSAALDYREAHRRYAALPESARKTTPAPRRDLAMETMVEIIEGKRFITCHSYVQSEINMLMKVAERFGFRINTFTHILEGYKVADKMAAHGVGGSSFADWWAYKWEVRYAIPYNPMLMHMNGVTVAINSDSNEMSRRLNQEAAKSVKYGGMSEEDAWKMVTLNPAKLLHLDSHMGSVKSGKDADLVLWSDHPLSIYAKVEKTLVDGIVYFDLEREAELVAQSDAERARLIGKILRSGDSGGKGGPKGVKPTMHCDTVGDLAYEGEME